ncbi:competence type IV pilus ATPase ComGA [Enterococcus pseudoavium]|uniref:Competence type IV pilus ATPase ComGA n=1 Tax=Enterococcus pseudoavium TaxID=44007 RepID=A0AAE4I1D7_9ENTE|nr:competence type IV pilus ATPase ComGA [Enterococcus pseudoavium]MDT2737785.1 competence type IV pilus ATPase ComGA [Enterococcus pseudoavium]MDT2754872.1 competence type IV pilus ATPase ComGA [Enterococcus pseudoavium]MDT2770309.1 competence type IV pilus ATPase ComGA [Enterococcus pseudoavium]
MEIEQLSNELIEYGFEHQMQDFYLLPRREEYRYFFRRGPCYEYKMTNTSLINNELDTATALQLINRFKYLGQMDVSEKRKAQLGAISYSLPHGEQRLRLSTVGDYLQQESLVIRFLHQFGRSPEVYHLPEQLAVIQSQSKRRGLYLFCGPVGSGKTTLMYKLAREMVGQVITIEDPVEIEEPDFLQLQVNEKIQQSYDELIKLSLRHHPDVLIIGEVRDKKTIQGAIRAALTGHCVYATLHAASLESAQARVFELGGEAALLQECLQGIVYQELLPVAETIGLLTSYHFYQENIRFTWEEGLKRVAQKQTN